LLKEVLIDKVHANIFHLVKKIVKISPVNHEIIGLRLKEEITEGKILQPGGISLKIQPHLKCVATLLCEISSDCCSILLIAPQINGIAGLSASSSSKVDTLNI